MNRDCSDIEKTAPESSAVSAACDLRSHLRLWPVTLAGLALDLWTKQWAFSALDPTASLPVIPRLLSFRRTLNEGALFGLGKGLWLVFIAASVLALGFVWYLFSQSTRDRRSLHVALGLILAGALGNLYDRSFVMADVVRTNRGTCIGLAEWKGDTVEVGSWPDRKVIQRFHRTADGVSVRRQGVVRDFIKVEAKFGFELYPWVFNVADALLVVGVGLLLLNFWWDRREAQPARVGGTSRPTTPAAS